MIVNLNTTWNHRRLWRHLAYWSFWVLVYASVNAGKEDRGFAFWAGFELVIMTVKVPFTVLMMYWLVPYFLIRQRYLGFLSLALAMALLGGMALREIYQFMYSNCFEGLHSFYMLSSSFFYKTLDLIYVSTFPSIYKLHQFYLEQEAKNRQVAEQKLHAELELLKNQLHPHFLFNTLNNLYGMILSQHAGAADVVVRLSELMRYMLYGSNGSSIELGKEVEQLKNYIELEKIRYGERLDISFECSGTEANPPIAPLLLIGFVENAFKHGVALNHKHAWIRINLAVKDGLLDFMIENSVSTDARNHKEGNVKGGIGIANIKKRLDLIYNRRYELRIIQRETYLAHLKLSL